jgi:hypothetical protein
MHDDVAVVEQTPPPRVEALTAHRFVTELFHLAQDMLPDRLDMSIGGPRADDDEVGVADLAAQIDDRGIERLAIPGQLGEE